MLKAPEHLKYWSRETNPETGEQFEIYRNTLMDLGNPEFDIEKYLEDDYAAKQTERLHRRFQFSADPMGEKCLEYYRSIGLKKEMHNADSFFERWVIFTPLEAEETGKRYPLIIIAHGGMNTIETEEFSDGFTETAAEEGYMVLYPQNTNEESILAILDDVRAHYPVDPERVYIGGFSQGGYQIRGLVAHHPELFAGYAPCGNDLYRTFDFHRRDYTEADRRRLTETFVPFLQIVGACEPNYLVPKTLWKPRWTMLQDLRAKYPGKYDNVRTGMDFGPEKGVDPTYPYDENGNRLPTLHPAPAEGENIPEWALNRLNLRLEVEGCEKRDVAKCLSYMTSPDSEVHERLHFYGDRDGVEYYYGRKHFVADIWNRDGLHAFRFVAVDNAPHWPTVAWNLIGWDFFREFKRDAKTGRLVADRYEK